jgi:hypothetical protein
MKILVRLVFMSVLWFPALAVDAHAQARDMAFEFKMTDSGATTVPGVSTGHAVVSRGRVRLDVKGSARALAMPGVAGGDDIIILMLDSGKTIIYINPKTKQYMQLNPMETMDRMQKMMEGMGATMKFEFTGEPKIDNVGLGPVILGHKTQHYRITTGMKMTMNMMGDSQTMEVSSVSDEYLAPDLKNIADPFRNMSSGSGTIGGTNKEFVARLKAAQAKLPNAMELRAEMRVTVNSAGQAQHLTTIREITGIQSTTASNAQFVVPAAFTKVDFPLGAGGGRVPPE